MTTFYRFKITIQSIGVLYIKVFFMTIYDDVDGPIDFLQYTYTFVTRALILILMFSVLCVEEGTGDHVNWYEDQMHQRYSSACAVLHQRTCSFPEFRVPD